MFKSLRIALAISLYSTLPLTDAKTIFYDGTESPESSGWFTYGQLPFPESSLPLPASSLPSSLKSLIAPAAEGMGSPTLNTDLGLGNEGYAGYSNYKYTMPKLSPAILLGGGGVSNLKELLFSGSFEPVNAKNPLFDRSNGFDLTFQVAVTQEESQANRAGFNLVVIASDGKGIELGFKRETSADRIFAQSEQFQEAEEASALDLSIPTDYVLKIKDEGYLLLANEKEILSGDLRQYEFDPAQSSPPLPFNPYATPNFLFLGDDTDQGNSSFTLGEVAISFHSPALGQADAINAKGENIETTAQFNGGITVNGQVPQTKIVQNLSDDVEVSGEISTDTQHVGQVADVIVYAAYKPSVDSPQEEEVFYMLDQANNILLWDGTPANLVAFQPEVTLSPKQLVEAYQGQFLLPGHLCISFGYLLREEGTLITNAQCIEVTIEP